MKKVLLISYFCPPSNLTAAQRIGAWEKHMTNYGYFPVIITRNWTGKELSEEDRIMSSGSKVRVLEKDHSTIYYLPYVASLRDQLFIRSKKHIIFSLSSKAVTLLSLFLQMVFIQTIPFNNLYFFARKYLKEHPDVRLLIISGNPFEQFFFGYLLKKEFKDLKWVADYRDDWTTTELHPILFRPYFAYFEKKWIQTASIITSISPYYTQKIATFVGVPGATIYNGFDTLYTNTDETSIDSFVITYNGTLYRSQPIEIFLDGFVLFLQKNKDVKIHLNFPGLLLLPKETERVRNKLIGFNNYFTITDRLPKQDVINLQKKSDLLLMVAHKGIKGIPSSKIFEYISLKKAFIVCPGDGDILEEIAHKSSLGFVLNSSAEVFAFLQNQLDEKRLNHEPTGTIDDTRLLQFSVSAQTEQLCSILDKL